MNIANRKIGQGHAPFVIAEMSGNHNQSLDRALALVEAAAKAGAHGLKLQTYTADTMTLDIDEGEFHVSNLNPLWNGSSLYDLYQQAHTPWEWHEPIFKRAAELGIIAFSTPFDSTAVDLLEALGAPCYKIASFENTDLPLIRKVAATGKPLIMSTGMASIAELDEAVTTARAAGCKDLVLLKCTSSYPATPENTNLATIPHMRRLFDCEIGLSDHTMGMGAAIAAVALGASVIEKHFTIRRADGGVDSTFSAEPEEIQQLVIETERAWQAIGEVRYGATESEKKSKAYRRSIYITRDVKAGEILSLENIRIIRPGSGLPPGEFDRVMGRTLRKDAKRGTPLSWDLI